MGCQGSTFPTLGFHVLSSLDTIHYMFVETQPGIASRMYRRVSHFVTRQKPPHAPRRGSGDMAIIHNAKRGAERTGLVNSYHVVVILVCVCVPPTTMIGIPSAANLSEHISPHGFLICHPDHPGPRNGIRLRMRSSKNSQQIITSSTSTPSSSITIMVSTTRTTIHTHRKLNIHHDGKIKFAPTQ